MSVNCEHFWCQLTGLSWMAHKTSSLLLHGFVYVDDHPPRHAEESQ